MASPFQKYQGEQVQQIPAGYVEAMGSMGKAYQQIGASIAGGLQEADKRAQEEAKLQGSLAPYIKNDPRIQTVDGMIRGGTLVKKDDGTVGVAPEYEGVWDSSKAKPIIDFYNQTGGDGSKLTGTALTKFATEFEAQQKYDSAQAAKVDKEVERQKTLAEINKLNAEAAEKTANAAGNAVVAGYSAGTSFAPTPSAPLGYTPQAQPSQAYTGQIVPYSPTNGIKLSDITASLPSGFSVDRYNAGTPLATQLNSTSVPAPAPVVPTAQPVTPLPALPSPTEPLPEVVATTEALRVEYAGQYKKDSDNLTAELSSSMIALGKSGGATPERIKSLNETYKIRRENLDKAYSERTSLIDSRVKAATTIVTEGRAVAGEKRAEITSKIAQDREAAAKVKDKQDVLDGKMKQAEFDAKWGVEASTVPAGTSTAPAPQGAAAKPGTFANFQHVKVEGAGNIPGRVGGTESEKLKEETYQIFQKRKSDYPARWGIGVFHTGAKEFQLDLNYRPTSSPIEPGSRAKINEHIEGYSEAQTYLKELSDVVDSTDDNRITNFLNRSLWTASTEAKKTVVTGDMMNQFGVAAFRRAIVSGGNFSDADREYVAKLITDINSAHIAKDKDLFKAQTQALARFIDQKYRSTLAANDITFDTATSRKYLEREGDKAGLEQLSKAEQYVRVFNIDTKDNKAPVIDTKDLPSEYDRIADNFEKLGQDKQAKIYRKQAEQARQRYEDAAKEAEANVNRTRKK
jgi:hypothetical protein